MRATGRIKWVMLHTGQHYDSRVSDVFFSELDIDPQTVNLYVGFGTCGVKTAQMLACFERSLLDQRPDWALQNGDTNSTLAGALAASNIGIPIAYVEAGLRYFSKRMIEEIATSSPIPSPICCSPPRLQPPATCCVRACQPTECALPATWCSTPFFDLAPW